MIVSIGKGVFTQGGSMCVGISSGNYTGKEKISGPSHNALLSMGFFVQVVNVGR